MGTLRIILAIAVILGHCGGFFGYTISSGVIAVQIFYMISGFFMALILSEKGNIYKSKVIFYINRFIRIYSTYYVVFIISAIIYIVMYFVSNNGPIVLIQNNLVIMTSIDRIWAVFTNLFIVGIETSLFMSINENGLFFSSSGPDDAVWPMMLVVPAWSICLELIFYIIAPYLSHLKSRWLVLVVIGSLALRVLMYKLGFDEDPWNYRFFPLEIAFFLAGMLSYRSSNYLLAAMTGRTRKLIAVGVILCVCISQPTLRIFHKLAISEELFRWPLYAFVLLALPALFSETRNMKWDGKLADFSYPLYLIHWPVVVLYASLIGIDRRALNWHNAPAAAAICVIISLLGAWALIRIVERPINLLRAKITQRLILKRTQSCEVASTGILLD